MAELTARDRRQLRQIAHHLDPVVTVADQGVSPGVAAETERALADHELIKVRLALVDRDARKAAGQSLAETCGAVLVQSIGKVIVLFRANPKADPKLSNIARHT